MYSTILFHNGRALHFRLRDANYNRFKVCLSQDNINMLTEAYPDIDWDDCNGDEFATICRWMSNQ